MSLIVTNTLAAPKGKPVVTSYTDALFEMAQRETSDESVLRQKLEVLVEQAQSSGKPLQSWFFEEAGFEGLFQMSDPEQSVSALEVIETKKGTCLPLASIYLALAERLDVEAIPMATPRHVFIRVTNGDTSRNVELLERGKNKPTVSYILQEKAPVDDRRAKKLLRELSPDEFLAYLLNNRGVQQRAAGDAEAAEESYLEALQLDPDCQPCHYNYANLLAAEGDSKKARKHYDKALKLHPWDEEARGNREIVAMKDDPTP